jgi:predicted nucleotidyltransferase component of viral defense system
VERPREREFGGYGLIPQREIIAWRTAAPWPSDAQVEQDLLITRCVAAIFGDEFLRDNVAMRGGTALHKIHLAPAARYSEDIDLVLLTRRRDAVVKKHLTKVLQPIMNSRPSTPLNDAIVGVRNLVSSSKIIRQSYAFTPTQPGAPKAKLKVEVNCSEHEPVYKIVTIPFDTGPGIVEIRTCDIDEMLGTKMRALFQRDQSRDLFDLNRALTDPTPLHRPDPDRIVFAFRKYMEAEGSRIDANAFRRNMTHKLDMSSFRNDMNQMLRPGTSFDADAAARLVMSELIDRLDQPRPREKD